MKNAAWTLLFAGLVASTGCLTPSMGRTAEVVMGGQPCRYPLSVRDTPTAQLVGQSFDGTTTEGWLLEGQSSRSGSVSARGRVAD